jgi:hypothetical protein
MAWLVWGQIIGTIDAFATPKLDFVEMASLWKSGVVYYLSAALLASGVPPSSASVMGGRDD